MMKNIRPIWLTIGGVTCAAVNLAAADPATTDDNPWEFKTAFYLWGAGIDGNTQAGGSFDIGFDTIAQNLDFGFMGAFEARKGKWSVATDLVYMDASADDSGTVSPVGIPVGADVDLKGWVINLQGARSVYEGDHASINVLAGARFLDVDNDLSVSGPLPFTANASDSALDGVVGVKGEIQLPKSFYLSYYADVGTGQSDFTWQAFGGLGYAFKRIDLFLGYRYNYWDLPSDYDFKDLSFGGPLLGAAFKF